MALTTRKLPDIFFDNRTGSYWLKLPEQARFLNLDARNVKLHFRLADFNVDKEDDSGLKDGDRALLMAQLNKAVDYAGPLAGHTAGIIKTQAGKTVLVTSETAPVPAVKGECDFIEAFFGELLGGEQAETFFAWLKVARESMLEGDFRPGQMLVLAGPSGCGKSLTQSIITELLGGRMAKPYRYMTGATNFNSDLASAEHLVIADEQASIDIRSRRNFGAAVKDLTVNLEMSVHAKGREAITLPTFRRVSVSVNNEPENLSILPPLDESLLDKITLFKCSQANVGSNRKAVWKRFCRELPAFAFMLEKMRIPKRLHDDRYLVRAYHNPELVEIVSDISPEARLLSLIDEVIFSRRQGETHIQFKERTGDGWTGSAIELESELRKSPFAFAVDKLLSFSSAAGTYLARLQNKFPDRFSQSRNRGKTNWRIETGDRGNDD